MTQQEFDELLPNRNVEGSNPYNLTISMLDYGFVIEYGCKKIALENSTKLEALFALYLNSPTDLFNLWYSSPQVKIGTLEPLRDV